VNGSTTADPAAVEDCWGCPDVDAVVAGADVPDDAVVVVPDAGEAAVAAGVAGDLGPDAPRPAQAVLPAMAMTIATVPAILIN
jgi:hypothetical protein